MSPWRFQAAFRSDATARTRGPARARRSGRGGVRQAAVAAWELDEAAESRLDRLRERRVLCELLAERMPRLKVVDL